MYKRLALLAALAAPFAFTPSAIADSGGATVRALPESEALEGSAEVHHECPGYASGEETCDWFASASTYSASTECPQVFDASRGSWVGSPETTPGGARSTFTIEPYGLSRDIRVCLYVNTNSEGSLVGQSHVFDRSTGSEVLPPKPKPHIVTSGKCPSDQFGMLNGGGYPAIGSLSAVHLPARTDGVAVPCLVAESIARAMQTTWALRKLFPATVRPRGSAWHAGTFHCAYRELRGEEDPYVRAECHRERELVTMDLTS